MANATVLAGGQINGAGATDALFLKVFGGEVMAAFETALVFNDSRQMVRSIASGKSAQFPATGRVTAAYHTPGTEIVGQTANNAERIITLDDLLVSSVFFANIDEAKSHFDFRSPYTQKAGFALASAMDKNVAQVGILAARAAAVVTGEAGGSVLTNAAYATDSAVLAQGFWAAAQALDEKFVASEGRAMFLRPAQFYILVQNLTLLNQQWGGVGSYSAGTIPMVAGIEVVKTNNLPSTNVTTGPAAYQGNFSTTVGLVMNKEAVGTVKLLDLATESDYDIRRQGTLIVSKYAVGHGILRADCAVELKTA
jgi:hypothetical protein